MLLLVYNSGHDCHNQKQEGQKQQDRQDLFGPGYPNYIISYATNFMKMTKYIVQLGVQNLVA